MLLNNLAHALLVLFPDLFLQLLDLLLQFLLILSQQQPLQLLFGGLLLELLAFIVDLRPFDIQRRQRGVIGQQLVALSDGLPLLDVDLLDLLGIREENLLHPVGGHHAAGLGGIAPVVGHAEIRHGVYVHIAPVGIAGQRKDSPYHAAGDCDTADNQQHPLHCFIHLFPLR